MGAPTRLLPLGLRVGVAAFLAFDVGMALAAPLVAQTVRVRDLTMAQAEIPVRLQGFGLVVGLDGSGDRVIGGFTGGPTVRSIANLLRNFGVEVPENLLRTRNAAAVLVTAEVSPYLRPGGRFEVQVASLGDASSLRGGMLWMTPMSAGMGIAPVATAQGSLMLSNGIVSPVAASPVETSGGVPDGGLLEQPMPRPDFASGQALLMKTPDFTAASLVADAVNAAVGAGTATVEDPGAVTLDLQGADAATTLRQIGDLTVTLPANARIVIDGRDGTVVVGGDVRVGAAVVSHGSLTLAIGNAAAAPGGGIAGDVRMPVDASVQDVAAALHAVAAPPSAIATVMQKLAEVGAITAQVIVR